MGMRGMDAHEDKRLADLVHPFIDKREDEKVINAAWVAVEVLKTLDPDDTVRKTQPLIYLAAHSALQQTARSILRRKYPAGRQDGESKKDHVLPGFERLQRRYPQAHNDGEERGYILRESMTEDDWRWNLAQFSKDIVGRQLHREQFRRWGLARGWTMDDNAAFGTA